MKVISDSIDKILTACNNLKYGHYYKFSLVVEMSYPGLINKLRDAGFIVSSYEAFFTITKNTET